MKKNISCIVQARMGSSRLPGKILLTGYDKPLLIHLVERIKKSKKIDKVIVATTNNKLDNIIFNLCKKNKIDVFRGEEKDVLTRYLTCAKKFKTSTIVRITSDCPLIDHQIIDDMLKKYEKGNYDFYGNTHPATFPDGYDIEIFSYEALKKSHFNVKNSFQREHVTPYIWDNPKKFLIGNYRNKKKNYQNHYRLTLDFIEDYYVISFIYNNLYPKKKLFKFKDVINFLKKNKYILKINKKYIKVNWYSKHMNKLKTITNKDTKIIKKK